MQIIQAEKLTLPEENSIINQILSGSLSGGAIMKKVFRLIPVAKDYLWGGNKLRKMGKSSDRDRIAETWELSFHKDGPSRTEDGRILGDVLTADDLGENCKRFADFPVLVKLIDSAADLSVQVHPDDEYALRREGCYGKTEMWYIVDAEPGAGIYLGLKRKIDPAGFLAACKDGTVTGLLRFHEVKAGESYFIPAGTVHAIGKGVTVCEIQQNSNLTYRVYDYKRKGADGKERELHLDKAMDVIDFDASDVPRLSVRTKEGRLVGASKYFSAYEREFSGETVVATGKGSFSAVTFLSGEGTIDGQKFSAGDTFFIPAGKEKTAVVGEAKAIMTEIRKYYVGIDLGGTFIKGGIVNDLGEIVLSDQVPTQSEEGAEKVTENISSLVLSLLGRCGMKPSDVCGIGIGAPGMIDSAKGEVIFANNLGWHDVPLAEGVSAKTGIPVRISNDANVAALGETVFGAGKRFNDTVLFTLGTGVGGGIVIGKKLFEGNRSAGAEIGHMVIMEGGEPCTCGRKGCLEAYASATALIRDTRRAMEAHPDSKMWECGGLDKVTGKTAFDYEKTDPYAKEVVERYETMLACGIANVANVFRPQAVLLGGGVCAQGDNLVKPLQKLVDRDLYAGDKGPACPIYVASLGNRAGILGAAALWM